MIVGDDDCFRQRSSRSPDERSDIRVFGLVPHVATLMRATYCLFPRISLRLRGLLAGCPFRHRLALIDAALLHPSRVRALVLIAPAVSGAPEPIHPPDIAGLMARLKDAEQAGDLDRVNAIKAHHWLDGPLQPEGRVAGEARRLFLDMNAIALRSPPIGANLDVAPTFQRLGEISAPSLVLWGDLDFPHIQERCRHIATTMPNGSGHVLTGTAHLPSLEQPTEITDLVATFIDDCAGRPGIKP